MPTISVERNSFLKAIGRPQMTDDDMSSLCFDFGIELDDIVEDEGKTIYRIDVPANRYDLVCFEGLSRAMGVFVGHICNPTYTIVEPKDGKRVQILVTESTKAVRPHIVAAVLRNIAFTPANYQSFMDLQEKLHQNICRKRTLVAIGTHDLNAVCGPFTYDARAPSAIKFAALNRSEVNTAAELMHLYEADDRYAHLKPYLPIIKNSPVYPVVLDANGEVLSLPPIINGNLSRIKLSTTDILIECTATDHHRAEIVVNIMVTMFSEYCALPFTVEPVDIVQADGTVISSPNLSGKNYAVTLDDVARLVTIPNLTTDQAAVLLNRMMLTATKRDDFTMDVHVPATRADVMHVCDVVEDVAVGYGFGNVERTVPKTNTVGSMQPINKLTEQLREETARIGFNEALNFALISRQDNFTAFGIKDHSSAVVLENPATIEFQVVRTHLLPGLLKTTFSNSSMPLPLRLFEAGDIVVRDTSRETGTRNERHLAAMHYGMRPEFELIHGLLDRVMQSLSIKMVTCPETNGYYLAPRDDPAFFPGRCAAVIVHGKVIGTLGMLHPNTLKAFNLNLPASVFEINIELLMD